MKIRNYTMSLSVSLPPDMHEQMSEVAHQRRISKGQLIREALSVHLRQYLDETGGTNINPLKQGDE